MKNMNENIVARKYAKAIFCIVSENKIIIKAGSELEKIVKGFNSNIIAFFSHPGITKKEKRYVLSEVLEQFEFSEQIISFMYVLINNNKIKILSGILEQYNILKDKSEFLLRGEITITETVSSEWAKEIEEVFVSVLKKKIVWSKKIDNSLLAGFKVKIDDKVFDASIKKQIEKLNKQMIGS
jgi:F-type H+-transporting ATPase subunit delta